MTISMLVPQYGENPSKIFSVTVWVWSINELWLSSSSSYTLMWAAVISLEFSLAQPFRLWFPIAFFCNPFFCLWMCWGHMKRMFVQNLASTAVLLRGLGYTVEVYTWSWILGWSHYRIGATTPDTAINLGTNWSLSHKYISYRFNKHNRKKSNLYSYCGNGVNSFEPVSFNLSVDG